MSAPIFSPSVATSAVGFFPGQLPGKVRGTGAWYDDLWATVSPAITGAVKGGIQLGQTALENLVVKGQRKLGVQDSGQVFVNPSTGKAYPIVTQNGAIYLRDELGQLVPYTQQSGYVTTKDAILGTAGKYAPWVIGGLAVVAAVYFVSRRRR